ncbi:4-hydroxybenzoate synthetase (chorismate-pyruvate lyase) [Allochromatium warmingii]|uniref:4-hydroxybenzoate synthetase (Chorismate-pyruvate lyase) n=1 Tax=Allochromatium warmingii TaxID=61595 RepID=A0A1H3B5T1_ALLWA|nr:chorismate pyruvate-lyase family protein [Allochromatium warmingii]SDX37292.1 4-hydroxybenzoate synthetase (chorismate-pyruvate lyase) [Allochromatium warmingii]
MDRYYGRAATAPIEPPFRCDGFVRDGQLIAANGERLAVSELPPFLRALMVTDGTVTKILEAYFWEPVSVETLEQRFEIAREPVPWLDVERGDACLIRDAQLRGGMTGRCFAEAFSLIRTQLIPPDFRQRLIDREIGIGVLIRDSGLESYREVLDIGLERTASGAAVFRTYRIIIAHQPVILITEYFPLALYRGE